MIESLRVQNFRCLRNFEVDGIKPITLIAGKNNIGKSTMLEAMFFMYDHANGTPFLKMNRIRGEALSRSVHNTWESVFYNMDTDRAIQIDMTVDEKESMLRFSKEDTSLLDLSKELANTPQAATLLTNMSPYALKMYYSRDNYQEEADYVFVSGVEHTQLVREVVSKKDGQIVSKEVLGNMTYIANSNNRDDSIMVDLLSKLEFVNRKSELISIIRMIDEDVTDVIVLSMDGIAQVYVRKDNLTVPLRYSGDGMVKLVGLALRILADPGCVLLVDEIENGLHHSMYQQLWKVISKAARMNGCQIIATTHSYECITASVFGIEDSYKDDYCYVRLDKKDGSIIPEVFDYDTLNDALEIEAEVR